MQPNIYKFFIDGIEVYPNYKTLTKKYSKENNQRFFRETLEGEIKLHGADYFLIKNSSIHIQHEFLMQKKTGNSFEDYYHGTFNKTDCEIDNDKRVCKIKVTPKDMYSDIMNNYDNEYNLLDLAPALTPVIVSKRPILQVYVYGDNIINNFLPSGATWESEVDSNITLTDLYEKGYFELQGNQLELKISNGSEFDGVYAGQGWEGWALTSPTNPNYIIYGSVNQVAGGYDYAFNICKKEDITTSLYMASDFSETRHAVITFLGSSTETAGKIFTADVSMETTLCRVLTGFSVTNDGGVALGKLSEGDFGYLDNYSYVFSASQMATSIVTPATSENPTSYGKSDNGFYFTEPKAEIGKYYSYGRSTWVNSSRWIYLNEKFKSFDLYGSTYSSIKDCIHISDVIKALLQKIAPGIKHEATTEYSNFLYGEDNPIFGSHFDLFITQKTNIKKFIYDTPATKVPITFEKVMNMLAKCFCCYWFIDGDKLKIEHVFYFEHGKSYEPLTQIIGIDVTSTYNNKNLRSVGYGQNVLKYDKNSLPSRYEFRYMDESSIEFEGAAVKLTAAYLQQNKTESITPEDFSADIDMIISNTISISDEGFALLAAKKNNIEEDGLSYSTFIQDIELLSESGNTYTVSLQNGVLSWLYLFNFYCTNLPATIAEYDGYPQKQINVTGIARCMSQSIKIPVDKDPDLYNLINTEEGLGVIDSISIDVTNKQATIELLYEPE